MEVFPNHTQAFNFMSNPKKILNTAKIGQVITCPFTNKDFRVSIIIPANGAKEKRYLITDTTTEELAVINLSKVITEEELQRYTDKTTGLKLSNHGQSKLFTD
jgi:hypothetical protein